MCVWHGTKIEYLSSDGVPIENLYQWAKASLLEYIIVKEKPPSVTPCPSTMTWQAPSAGTLHTKLIIMVQFLKKHMKLALVCLKEIGITWAEFEGDPAVITKALLSHGDNTTNYGHLFDDVQRLVRSP